MAADDLCFLSIAELADQIKKKAVSPVEVTQAYLARIPEIDPTLNSYLTVTAEQAILDARQAENEILANRYRGPLHGIPLAYKDNIATKGIRTTCASKVLSDYIPNADAAVAERLHSAGSVLLGKLNMNEFATNVPSQYFGRVNNPWDVNRTPGGSSSGSGAAVAAGLCAGSLGTDTGGSIRIPAAFCGIVGFKPTHGRISLFGITPVAWALDHVGPMTRTVKDAALLLQVLAGYDARDLIASEMPIDDYTARLTGDVKGLRIGIPTTFFPEYTNPEVQAAFGSAVQSLVNLGASVEEVQLPDLAHAWAQLAQPIINAEANVWHEQHLQGHAQEYGSGVRKFLEQGQVTLATDYVKAIQGRARLRRQMQAVFSRCDVLLTPGQPIPPPLHTARSVTVANREFSPMAALVSASCPFNLTGHPALTIPCGCSATGLPLALQIVGRAFDEATMLQVGHAYERHTKWHEQRPPIEI
jgi:aspartyl-tRNA(Asn)/glutamyl-tRNA(Gln) amidotransferase subunit A